MLRQLLREGWILGLAVAISALYVALIVMRPSGEGFGRGLNLVAFWVYGSPTAFVLGLFSLWRANKTTEGLKNLAVLIGSLGVSFPVVAMLVIRTRS